MTSSGGIRLLVIFICLHLEWVSQEAIDCILLTLVVRVWLSDLKVYTNNILGKEAVIYPGWHSVMIKRIGSVTTRMKYSDLRPTGYFGDRQQFTISPLVTTPDLMRLCVVSYTSGSRFRFLNLSCSRPY